MGTELVTAGPMEAADHAPHLELSTLGTFLPSISAHCPLNVEHGLQDLHAHVPLAISLPRLPQLTLNRWLKQQKIILWLAV